MVVLAIRIGSEPVGFLNDVVVILIVVVVICVFLWLLFIAGAVGVKLSLLLASQDQALDA